jgi:hypothetical protein
VQTLPFYIELIISNLIHERTLPGCDKEESRILLFIHWDFLAGFGWSYHCHGASDNLIVWDGPEIGHGEGNTVREVMFQTF